MRTRQRICSQCVRLQIGLSCRICELADKRSRESTHAKKRTFHLAYVSHFNSAYNPQGELAHRQLSSANREGLFFDKVYSDSHAFIDSLAIRTKTFRYTRMEYEYVCFASYSLSTPNKRATESSTVSLLNLSTTIEGVSIGLSKSNRTTSPKKNAASRFFIFYNLIIFAKYFAGNFYCFNA